MRVSSPLTTEESIPIVISILVVYFALLLARSSFTTEHNEANPRKSFEFSDTRAKKNFVSNAREILYNALNKFGGAPFHVIADTAPTIILPNTYAHEIRNNPHLSMDASMREQFHIHLSSFATFRASVQGPEQLLKIFAQRQLTAKLDLTTLPLNAECTTAVRDHVGDGKDWYEFVVKDVMVHIVARLSSKIFLGDELCHNSEWVGITVDHTLTVFRAAEQMRVYPYLLRYIAHWLNPLCAQSRQQIASAKRLIYPVVEARREARKKALAEGRKPVEHNDGLDWFEEIAKAPYDPALTQLNLSVASIHTTSDLLSQTLLNILAHPEVLEPLRKEIIEVVSEGWQKSTFQRLKMLDSVIKETQRIKPIGLVSMRRLAEKKVTLKDGFVIPKGKETAVFCSSQWDANVYPSPETWDPNRFFKLRQSPGQENKAQLTTTQPEFLGFGHGTHACPGRFFSSNEIKIALCHLLLKYDWELLNEKESQPFAYGISLNVSPFAKVRAKRRQEEIKL